MSAPPSRFEKLKQFGSKAREYLDKKTLSGYSNITSGVLQTGKGATKLAILAPYAAVAAPTHILQKAVSLAGTKVDGSMFDTLKGKMTDMDKVPSFYKVTFLILFYLFFYRIFYDIGIFFGFKDVELILYMAWFGMILLFVSFIKSNRSRLYN